MEDLTIERLSKKYSSSKTYALHELSLNVRPGEAYGFLGPNGAGKSTTIRTLMNYIQPTSGSARILGKDIVKDSVELKKSIGYLSGDFAGYPKLTGEKYLEFMRELQPADPKYVRELTKRLRADLSKKLGDLSRGNRQKIGIIQAFMHKPDVLILDEPSSGLDPLMQEEFYLLVNEAKARGAVIFISSHILSEVQRICDRIGIIRDGKLIEERTIAELNKVASQTFDLTFVDEVPLSDLKKINGLKIVSNDDKNVTVHMHGKLSPLFAVLVRHEVTKLDARNLDLEEVFLSFYQNEAPKK